MDARVGCLTEQTLLAELGDSARETIRSAARKLTGFARRQFQAEVAIQYGDGHPRVAERVFKWGRNTVHTGLNELRTGIRCVDDFASRGRHNTEEQQPELTREIHALVEPQSQADPKFQTPLATTRRTAKAVREQLLAHAKGTDLHVPAERTVHSILNRLGYRLQRVRKTPPQKKSPKPMPSSSTCNKFTLHGLKSQPRSASRSTPKPR